MWVEGFLTDVMLKEYKFLDCNEDSVKTEDKAMQIVVCDDEEKIRDLLKEKIQRYCFLKNVDWNVYTCVSGEALLETDLEQIDVLFLDVDMPGKNGIETAQEIRKQNQNMLIVFLTAYSEFVFESFKVNAFRYLVKPLQEQELEESLESIMLKLCAPEDYLNFRFQNDTYSVRYAEIIYIEGMQDKMWIYCQERTYRWRGRMKSLNLQLKDRGFFQIHRSYIINMSKIKKYNGQEVVLEGGQRVPISKYRLDEFKEEYLKFWSKVI